MRARLYILLLGMLVLSGAAAVLGACNTTAGVGEDLSAAGKAIARSAEENKPR